jgi:hypothetical protein
MGFFGGGNSSTQTVVQTTSYAANPTQNNDLSGSIGGNNNQVSPVLQGGSSIGSFSNTSSDFFSPVENTPSINYGDSAIGSSATTAQAAIGALKSSLSPSSAASTSSTTPGWLSTLFSAPDIYYLIGGLVLIMLWRGHHR